MVEDASRILFVDRMEAFDICNLALVRLGQPPMSWEAWESGEGEPAITCRAMYGLAVRKMLRKHGWGFAIRRVRVMSVPFGGGWRGDLPGDCERVMYIFTEGGSEVSAYEVRGREIVSAEAFGWVEYVCGGVEVDQWDPLFTECVVLELASKLAGPICQSADLEQAMTQRLLGVEFPDAITNNARSKGRNNSTLDNLQRSLLLSVRKWL